MSRSVLALIGLLMAGSAGADASAPHVVKAYTSSPAAVAASGKASVWRIAGVPEGTKNAFFGVLELAPGAKVPVHRDATEEYIYVLSGTGEITIDGKTTAVQPGFGIFMPAQSEVSFTVTGSEAVRVVQFFSGQGPEKKYDGWAAPAAVE